MDLTTKEKALSDTIQAQLPQGELSQVRSSAVSEFRKSGLPSTRHEEFKHTPLTRELEKAFSLTGSSSDDVAVNLNAYALPLEANVIAFINGVFSREFSRIVSSASEFTISDLQSAERSIPEVQQHLGKYANITNDAYTAWNTAAWTEGLFVHVPKNTKLSHPIVIHHIGATNSESSAINRNLFVLETGAEATIIEKFDTQGSGNHFLNVVTEIVVGENSHLELYSINNDQGNRYQFNSIDIYQSRSSRVNTYTFSLDGKVVRNNLQLILDGEGIESHMYGLYMLKDNTLADNHTVVDHRKPNSFSNELYKGIMDGTSKGVFNGKIYVRPQAQKTNAFQANKNILLTDKASVNTKPQLEIWADDVKCSHGCTSGQLDEEALFYLRARGISKETARAMMLYAFAEQVIEQVKIPALKEYLDSMISERLHKNF
jgi:Fe-S cluster assembly protein SufD